MSLRLRRFFGTHLALAFLAALSLAADCGFSGGEGELHDACTRDDACRAPLVCLSGACAEPTRDSGMMDASSTDAAATPEAGVPGDAAPVPGDAAPD